MPRTAPCAPRPTRRRDESRVRPRRSRWTIYFYAHERHRLPHAAVRGPGFAFTVRLADGAVLASRGTVRDRVVREVQGLIADHRDLFIRAFNDTLAHRFPGTLDQAIARQQREEGGSQ